MFFTYNIVNNDKNFQSLNEINIPFDKIISLYLRDCGTYFLCEKKSWSNVFNKMKILKYLAFGNYNENW